MDLFTKLLTNKGALSLNENEGFEYMFEGTHYGTENQLEKETFEVTLKYGYFDAQSRKIGCILSVDVISESYKVVKYQGETIHSWETMEIDFSPEKNDVSGELMLNVRDKGFIWSYTDERQVEPLMIVTKKNRTKQLRTW